MRYVAHTMATAQTGAVVAASKQQNRAGVITASIAHTQPVLHWDAHLVSKHVDFLDGWEFLTTKLKCLI
jgi:hypothetical protein